MNTQEKTTRRLQRRNRIRAKVSGTNSRPRLSVFRSNTQIHAQLIDDEAGTTLAAVSSRGQKGTTPLERSRAAGVTLAKEAKEKGISQVVFDRGGYLYAGNIKALADAAREEGLGF